MLRSRSTARLLLPQPEQGQPLRSVRLDRFLFRDDGVIPNHPRWPLLLYRQALRAPLGGDLASAFEKLFARHGWGRMWRNGIFDYAHYHSSVHEVLGVARGAAKVRFGGDSGHVVDVAAGDAALLPAGTGHQCLEASADFLVVGAYPPSGAFDICRRKEDRVRALPAIARVPRPRTDPLYGAAGPVTTAWTGGE